MFEITFVLLMMMMMEVNCIDRIDWDFLDKFVNFDANRVEDFSIEFVDTNVDHNNQLDSMIDYYYFPIIDVEENNGDLFHH